MKRLALALSLLAAPAFAQSAPSAIQQQLDGLPVQITAGQYAALRDTIVQRDTDLALAKKQLDEVNKKVVDLQKQLDEVNKKIADLQKQKAAPSVN